jgi:hypothetical protein
VEAILHRAGIALHRNFDCRVNLLSALVSVRNI